MSNNDDELDALLKLKELDVPAEFTKTVMTSIQQEVAIEQKPDHSLSDVLQWLALALGGVYGICLLYTSPSPRDKRQSRMPSSA